MGAFGLLICPWLKHLNNNKFYFSFTVHQFAFLCVR